MRIITILNQVYYLKSFVCQNDKIETVKEKNHTLWVLFQGKIVGLCVQSVPKADVFTTTLLEHGYLNLSRCGGLSSIFDI